MRTQEEEEGEEEKEEGEGEQWDTVLKGIPPQETPVVLQLPVHWLVVQRAVRDHAQRRSLLWEEKEEEEEKEKEEEEKGLNRRPSRAVEMKELELLRGVCLDSQRPKFHYRVLTVVRMMRSFYLEKCFLM